jgi:hypothetical protein
MREVSLHLPAILTAAVARFVVGALWYSPVLFLQPWMRFAGITMEQVRSRMPRGVPLDLLGSILAAFGMAYLVGYSGAQGVDGGLSIAFLVWLGFVAPSTIAPVIYEGKPLGVWLLNNGSHLISFMAMGAILAAWG